MRMYKILLVVVLTFVVVGSHGQAFKSMAYRCMYQEQVMADYHNLLDTSSIRQFRTHDKYFSGRLVTLNINDSAIFLAWRPDTVLENGKQIEVLNLPWKAIYKTGFTEQSGGAFYTKDTIPVYWLSQLKAILSASLFRYPGNATYQEPSPDGLYNVSYKTLDRDDNEWLVDKNKEVIYTPGIQFYRICIDSFDARYTYNYGDGFLKNGYCYEVKRQKIGTRVLAKVKTLFQLQLVETSEAFDGDTIPDLNQYSSSFVMIQKLSYSQKVKRRIKNLSPFISLKYVEQLVSNIIEDSLYHVAGMLRSAILEGVLDQQTLTELADTLNSHSRFCRVLEDALAEAGTITAQHILAQLLNREGEFTGFYKRIILKAGVTAPILSPVLLKRLESFKRDTSSTNLASVSGLALANNAALMQSEGLFNEREEMLQFLRTCFELSKHQLDDTLQWLQEAGNSGDDAVLLLAENCINSNNKELRDEALYSLRFLSGRHIDSILASGLIKFGRQDLPFLTEICKLRFPDKFIRYGFYDFLQKNADLPITFLEPFIAYLISWKDEVKQLKSELSYAFAGRADCADYLKMRFGY